MERVKYVAGYVDDGMFTDNGWEYAFSGCTELKKVTLPESLEVIGSDAFENNTVLEKRNGGKLDD